MKNQNTFKKLCALFFGFVFSFYAQAATVALSNSPLIKLTTGEVKPNILFVLDDSGSMVWTYMPDVVDNFRGSYGYMSSQCNGVYYDPSVTYTPPVSASSLPNLTVPTRMSDASFTAAKDNGFDTSTTPATTNLDTGFIANRFVPEQGNTDYGTYGSYTGTTSVGPFSAVYYQYTGTVTDKDYINTGSTFFTECDTAIGNAAPFAKRRLATTITTPFVVNTATGGPTTTINVSGSSGLSVTSVTVNGFTITTGATSSSNSNSTVASRLASAIANGGYTATSSGSTVTISGPAGAAGFTPVINKSGSGTLSTGAFSAVSTVSLTVNGVALMPSSAVIVNGNTAATAANIAAKITSNGFSATVSSNVVTITGPASAINYQPIVTLAGSGSLTFATDVFPDNNAAKLTNFANWYSYYRTRMLTMKTSAAEAFYELDDKYRVGFMTINSAAPSANLATYSGSARTSWYDALYAVGYSTGGTPLRSALSTAGRYYANKLPSQSVDPVQYSCQQNFTILSTDGYWNGNGGVQLDGTTAVSNQDGGTTGRAKFDGSALFTSTFSRVSYSISTSGCSSGRKMLVGQTQKGTCQFDTGTCTPSSWADDGGPNLGSCRTTVSLPSPNPSDPTLLSTVSNNGAGATNTLADVAMYYYKTDLRNSSESNCTGGARVNGTSGDVCEDNVFKSARDSNLAQHMTTFTLGLGADGLMKFLPNYETTPGDYSAVADGTTADGASICSWQASGICNWPKPSANDPSAIDDMWHAAVNGSGTYFNANNPDTLALGLKNALVGIQVRKGAAAAAASSTLSPVAGNNASYFPTYTTNIWTGNLEARSINTNTGLVSRTATWCVESVKADTCNTALVAQTSGSSTIYNCETPVTASCTDKGGVIGYSGDLTSGAQYCKTQMANECTGTFTTPRQNGAITSSLVLDTSDTRTIKTSKFDTATSKNVMVDFDAAFATANPSYFDSSKLSGLSQWASLTAAQKTVATNNIIGYLRGQYGYDADDNNVVYTSGVITTDNRIFRKREAVLGDILESKPSYNGSVVFNYGYPGYDTFKTTQNSNTTVTQGTVYVGANDGMLHAFSANNGVERWAYIPSMVVPNLWKLAEIDYSNDNEHRNYVNGPPSVSDVCVSNCNNASTAVWKTILVGGLNQGGRGYYALDITNPTSPELLWEFTTTAGIGSTKDDDLGFSYGKPIIARKSDNTWVIIVTSGYNNVSPGNGKGYLYVLNAGTGAIISKISTNEGTSTTPSGLAKVAAWNDAATGSEVGDIYGGDLLGNVWKFNINTTTSAEIGTGSVSKFAKLYSDASGINEQPVTTTPVLGQSGSNRIIFVSTGKFLEQIDSNGSSTQTQSVYAIKDDGGATLSNPRNTLVRQTISVSSSNVDTRTVSSPQAVNFGSGRGWYVDLPDTGERVNVDAQLSQGVLIVPSLVPATTACTPNGYGWLNYFGYDTGAPVAGLVSEKSESPIVGVNIVYTQQGGKVIVTNAEGGTNNMGPTLTGTAGNFSGTRTMWRELIQ